MLTMRDAMLAASAYASMFDAADTRADAVTDA